MTIDFTYKSDRRTIGENPHKTMFSIENLGNQSKHQNKSFY